MHLRVSTWLATNVQQKKSLLEVKKSQTKSKKEVGFEKKKRNKQLFGTKKTTWIDCNKLSMKGQSWLNTITQSQTKASGKRERERKIVVQINICPTAWPTKKNTFVWFDLLLNSIDGISSRKIYDVRKYFGSSFFKLRFRRKKWRRRRIKHRKILLNTSLSPVLLFCDGMFETWKKLFTIKLCVEKLTKRRRRRSVQHSVSDNMPKGFDHIWKMGRLLLLLFRIAQSCCFHNIY